MDLQNLSIKKVATIAGLAVVAVIALGVVFGTYYTVSSQEAVVLIRFGAAQPEFVGPGPHFKLPFIDSIERIPTTANTIAWDRSTGTDLREEAYSYDQQPASVSISVLWHVEPKQAVNLYNSYKTLDGVGTNLISKRIPTDMKAIFGQYTAVRAIQERTQLNADILKAVLNDTDIANAPIHIDGIQVPDIQFSQAYIESIESAMRARVEVQKIEQQKQQQAVQAEITVINAEAAAKAQVAQATAEATSTKLRGEASAHLVQVTGEAEATAIKAKGDALRDNPQLVELTKAEKWNGVLPTTMIPGSTVPFLNAGK